MWTLNYFDFSKNLIGSSWYCFLCVAIFWYDFVSGMLVINEGSAVFNTFRILFFSSKSRDKLLLVNFQYFQDTVVRPKICKLVLSSAMRNSWPVPSVSIGSIKYLSYIWQLNCSSCWKRSSKNSNKKSFIIAPRTLPHPCCGNVTFCHCFACC